MKLLEVGITRSAFPLQNARDAKPSIVWFALLAFLLIAMPGCAGKSKPREYDYPWPPAGTAHTAIQYADLKGRACTGRESEVRGFLLLHAADIMQFVEGLANTRGLSELGKDYSKLYEGLACIQHPPLVQSLKAARDITLHQSLAVTSVIRARPTRENCEWGGRLLLRQLHNMTNDRGFNEFRARWKQIERDYRGRPYMDWPKIRYDEVPYSIGTSDLYGDVLSNCRDEYWFDAETDRWLSELSWGDAASFMEGMNGMTHFRKANSWHRQSTAALCGVVNQSAPDELPFPAAADVVKYCKKLRNRN